MAPPKITPSRLFAALSFRIKRIPFHLRQIRFRRLETQLKNRFESIPPLDLPDRQLIVSKKIPDFTEKLVYKDETWNYVKKLRQILEKKSLWLSYEVDDNHCENSRIRKTSNSQFKIDCRGEKNTWIYWYYPSKLKCPYRVSFDTRVNSEFHEFQVAFKCKSITDRFRLRVVENKELVFEVITKGFFFHELHKVPFSFELEKNHKIVVTVQNDLYSLEVNEEVILAIKDKAPATASSGFAFIFYEVLHRKIECDLENICLSQLEPESLK